MSAQFGAALSEHPVAASAVGEALGEILETVGEGPDLVCLFVTAPHVGALEDIARAVDALLHPARLRRRHRQRRRGRRPRRGGRSRPVDLSPPASTAS